MSYSLEAVHKIVDDCLNGEELNFSLVGNNNWSAELKKAIAEISVFKTVFLQKAVGMNEETLKTWVNISVVNCINLLNNIHRLLYVSPKQAFTGSETKAEFTKLESALLDQVSWLRNYFPYCFNADQYLPVILAQNAYQELSSLITGLRQDLQAVGVPLKLVNIIAAPVETGFASSARCTFRQLTYCQTLYRDIKKIVTVATGENAHQAIMNGLIHHNFNDPAFISHLIRELQKEIEENSSIENQFARWAFYKKKYQQIQVSGLSFHPGATTAKEAIIAAINEEINYLQQSRSLSANLWQQRKSISGTCRCKNEYASYHTIGEPACCILPSLVRLQYHSAQQPDRAFKNDCRFSPNHPYPDHFTRKPPRQILRPRFCRHQYRKRTSPPDAQPAQKVLSSRHLYHPNPSTVILHYPL